MTKHSLKKNSYWNNFYKRMGRGSSQPMPPSQFAAFCAAELGNRIKIIVDIAFGDGRDTLFFAQQGFQVFAFEKSSAAVNLLSERVSALGQIAVSELDVVNGKIDLELNQGTQVAYYSRFFLHTLTKQELTKFFENISTVMKENDYLFVEYRNEIDAKLKKVTEDHFRAFYSSSYVLKLAVKCQLSRIYEVEGVGFAKWKEDDASVTRQIFVKNKLK